MSKGNPIIEFRIEMGVYTWLKGRAGVIGVNEYVRQMIKKAYGGGVYKGVYTEEIMDVPIYDSKKHKVGDVVRRFTGGKWEKYTVPALDADGNKIYEGVE